MRPNGHYPTFFSFDPLNATAPGFGLVAGLHISISNVLLQYSVGSPPFVGTLDASGAASFSVPAAWLAPFSGLTSTA